MFRTLVRRNVANPGFNKFMGGAQGGSGAGPQGKGNMALFFTGAAGLTLLAYLWGYRGMDKRNQGDVKPTPRK